MMRLLNIKQITFCIENSDDTALNTDRFIH